MSPSISQAGGTQAKRRRIRSMGVHLATVAAIAITLAVVAGKFAAVKVTIGADTPGKSGILHSHHELNFVLGPKDERVA